MSIREEWIDYIHDLQNRICAALEEVDGKAKFIEDKWERAEGGGGKTRVITNGDVFEKGGVNTSVVYGKVTDAMRKALGIEGDGWFACGLSLVLHPLNPFVPTVHCNYRMFELYDEAGDVIDRWFGGGTDLTPYYLFEEDAGHFHQTYKNVCDRFDATFYPTFKTTCDNYFVNFHRNNERRGIGGIFYDHQRVAPPPPKGGEASPSPSKGGVLPGTKGSLSDDSTLLSVSPTGKGCAADNPPLGGGGAFWMAFGKACGNAFTEAYLPIVEKRKNTLYTTENKYWQEIRRGRYVEFNLIHDRGTLFGLKTSGRTESILMSLPPTVRFEYDYKPEPGSEEDKLLQACLHPRDWV